MASEEDLYSKVYVNADVARGDLAQLIADSLDGTASHSSVQVGESEIDIEENDDFDPAQVDTPDGFLFYRYYLDVMPTDVQTRDGQIAVVSQLLESFWSYGWPAVAAADYEEELPRRGGYNPSTPRRPAPGTTDDDAH